MAWLFLDTHIPGQFRVGCIGSGSRDRVRSYQERASGALRAIASLLKRRKPDGVCIVAGPGSFSSVRTGVLYANLLARGWNVPLVGVSVTEAGDLAALSARLSASRSTLHAPRSTPYVAPIYDAEPNITIPRPVASEASFTGPHK